MTSPRMLGLVAAWFVFGMARLVVTSKLAEYRIDRPAPGAAIAPTMRAAAARRDAANYDAQGRRLLPWYRAIVSTYWTLVAGMLWAIAHHA